MFHREACLETISRELSTGDDFVKAHVFFQAVKAHTDCTGSIADVMNCWLHNAAQSPPFLKHLLGFCCFVVFLKFLRRKNEPADHISRVRGKMLEEWEAFVASVDAQPGTDPFAIQLELMGIDVNGG